MFRSRQHHSLYPVLILLSILFACDPRQTRAPVIDVAYAGPATLKLRKELSIDAPFVATVKHGEKLEVVRKRRRFVLVRTENGHEGWTDERQLMTAEEIEQLQELASKTSQIPSQGKATVFAPLNVHAEPYRQSPSFSQIQEGDVVDVVGHRVIPRTASPPERAKPAEQPSQKSETKKEEPEGIRPPSRPQGPPVPQNWLELSNYSIEKEEARKAEEAERKAKAQAAIPMDDWSLVRTTEGAAGWVLTRALFMKIPDEVAQYAQGQRITSYFSLGEVKDGDQIKHNWLWTTMSNVGQPFQFDGFRVFIWNTRRHRFETAYSERNLRGYFPVELHDVQVAGANKTETLPGFSVIVEDENGNRVRKSYSFEWYRIRLVSQVPLPPVPEQDYKETGEETQVDAPAANDRPSYLGRVKEKVLSISQEWLNK